MPLRLFRGQHKAEGATKSEAATATAEPPVEEILTGLLPCSQAGCPRPAGPCSYIDRRFHGCDTAWCVEHGVVLDGRAYCRRHAGVVRALVDPSAVEAPPDVDSRAASLVAWVCRDIEGGVMGALDELRGPDEELRVESMRLVFKGRGRHRTWQHAWKLAGHAGFSHWVAIQVVEEEDEHVIAIVDGLQIFHSTPPWIVNRRQGIVVGADEDVAQRARWYGEMVEAIRSELRSGSR